jgi:hypothetical protein
MSAALRRSRRRPPPRTSGEVLNLVQARIDRALPQRTRYRYVVPRVECEGLGWKIVSPNCSRNIDPTGGDIAIAWLVPLNGGRWLLHSRDHRQDCWRLEASDLPLDAALQRICADPLGVFWP